MDQDRNGSGTPGVAGDRGTSSGGSDAGGGGGLG